MIGEKITITLVITKRNVTAAAKRFKGLCACWGYRALKKLCAVCPVRPRSN